MGTVSYQVKKIGMLLEQSLAIPSYQRPYKWQQKHVNLNRHGFNRHLRVI